MNNMANRFLSVFLCFVSCSVAIADDVYIEKGRVGDIEIGMDVFSLIEEQSNKVTEVAVIRGGAEVAYAYQFDQERTVILETESDGTVWAIRIEGQSIKTRKSVGVGSLYEDVIAAYPDSKLNFGIEDGGYLSLFVPSLNGFFSFDIHSLDSALLEDEELPEEELEGRVVDVVVIHDL